MLEMVKRANTAPSLDEATTVFERDEVLKALRARLNQATTKEEKLQAIGDYERRAGELGLEANQLLDRIRMRDMFLNIIEIAKQGEINYLRQCESCGNIFFAGRKDQRGCSTPCLNRLRKSRWRKNYAAAKAGEKRGYLKLKKRADPARKRR